MNIRLKVAAVGAATIAVTALGLGNASASSTGGLDLNSYCQAEGFYGVTLTSTSPPVYGWRCVGSYGLYGIDMQAACRWQYPQYQLRAVYSDPNDPYSWYCAYS
jgi:hypothetical protein